MKKFYIRNLVVGLFFVIVLSSAVMNQSGPGGGYSNAPGESNCTSCHSTSSIITSGNSNLSNIRLQGGFTGNGYIPDSTYTMVLTFKQTGISKSGFQVTCLDKTDNPCGTLTDPNVRVQKSTATVNGQTRQYIEHTSTGTAEVATDSNRWVFTWKAPNNNIGTVSFYVVVNATNNNSDDANDLIYGKRFDISPSTLLPVANASSLDSVTCTNYTVQLKGSGTNSPTSYTWNTFSGGGNPTGSTAQNPTVTYATQGTKFAILKVKNSKGTSLPDTLKIIVSNSPAATFQTANPTSICKGDSLQLFANPVTSATYLWPHNNKTGRSIYVKDSGNYKVKVTHTITGCATTSGNFHLDWYNHPTISISKGSSNDSFCDSYSETFTATGSFIDSVHWYVNGVLTRRTKTLTTVFTGSSNIIVSAIAKSTTNCKSTFSNSVTIIVRPKLFPSNIVFSKTTGTIDMQWKKPQGISSATYSLNNVNFFPTTTDSTLLLTGLSANTTYTITIRSKQPTPCLSSDVNISIKTNACSNLSYSIDFIPRACKGSAMTATIKKLYNAKYSISFNNNSFSKDTIFNFTANKSDTLLISVIDSLSPTCPPLIDKIGYQVDTLIDKDTGSLIKFNVSLCDNSYVYSLKSGYTVYEFYKNNILLSTGSNSSFIYTGLASGDKLSAIGKINTCQYLYGPVGIVINSKPISSFTFVRNWKTYTFTATDNSLTEYNWFAGSISLGSGQPKIADFTTFDNSTVTVKLVTKNFPGCTDSSSQDITVPKFSTINEMEGPAFKLYPNPFEDEIIVESQFDKYQIQVLNGVGQLVFRNHCTELKQTIVTSDWANGIYYFLINDQENRLISFKFIKY